MSRLHIVATEPQIRVWKDAAFDSRMTLSEWVRQELDKAAAKKPTHQSGFDAAYGPSK